MEKTPNSCMNCRHFHITWDKTFPYGCKAMGFKSKTLPSQLTQQASGQLCLSFSEKIRRPES